MTRIYFVRHGESTGNTMRVFCGRSDVALTEKGIAQGRCLGDRFKNIKIDALYTSPLVRARETAALLCLYHPEVKAIVDPVFEELGTGALELQSPEVMERDYPDLAELWRNQPWDFIGPGAQDGGVRGLYERIVAAIERIVQNHPDQTAVISSHGYASRVFHCYILGLPLERIGELKFGGNASITCADFSKSGEIEVQFVNDDSHLVGWCRPEDASWLEAKKE